MAASRAILSVLFAGALATLGFVSPARCAQPLGLEEYFRILQEDHPYLQQRALRARADQIRREQYLDDQDWGITATPGFRHREPVDNSYFSPDEIDESALEASLGRGFWTTGGRFSLRWQSAYTEQDLPALALPGLPGPSGVETGAPVFYRHRLVVDYDQPLLRNRGGSLDRLDYELGGYAAQVGSLQAVEEQERFLADMGALYLDWALLREQASIAQRRLELADEQLVYAQRQRDANLIDRANLLRSQQAVHKACGEVVLLTSQAEAQAQQVALVSGRSDLSDRAPSHDLYRLPDSLPALAQAESLVARHARVIQALDVRLRQLERSRRAFAEMTRPQVDLRLGAGLVGGDRAFSASVEMDRPEFSVALFLRHRFGARAADTKRTVAELEMRQVRRRRDHRIDRLTASVRTTLLRMRDLERVLHVNQAAIEAAEETASEEQRLYQQGRQQLLFVITAQDDVQRARMTRARNAARYQMLHLQLRELLDGLLPSLAEAGATTAQP